MATRKAVHAWELAYRRYGEVSAEVARSRSVDAVTAERMADASSAVAGAWRALSDKTEMSWWLVAAIDSAAQAFEGQSREWEIRMGTLGGDNNNGDDIASDVRSGASGIGGNGDGGHHFRPSGLGAVSRPWPPVDHASGE